MADSSYTRVVHALFSILSHDLDTRMQDRKALTLGCRELGLSASVLSDEWRVWKAHIVQEDTGDSKLDNDDFLLLLACLVHEQDLSDSVHKALHGYAAPVHYRSALLARVLPDASRVSLMPFAQRLDYLQGVLRSFLAGPVSESNASDESFYVANQVSEEGFDELQRLCMARALGLHTALDGPPGVGKTQSIVEVCRIFNVPLFTKNCSTRTTEAHIIASPILRSESGVSVTDYQNGPLARALECGGVFYGDEFNLLKEDVQKRLNSAFDDRRHIDRPDGMVLHAAKGFWALISYNPSETLSSRDLEESVADRFIHMHYTRWPADFKAWVSLHRAKKVTRSKLQKNNDFGLRLNWRGIEPSTVSFFEGEEQNGGIVWKDFFTSELKKTPPSYVYLVCDTSSLFAKADEKMRKNIRALADQAYSDLDLARLIARFTELLYELSIGADSPMLKKIGLGNLREKEDIDLLRVHVGSTRIESAAAKTYAWLCARGCNRFLAQSYASSLVIDQACYGQYRTTKLREMTTYELLRALARSMRLIPGGLQLNTNFKPELLLGAADRS